MFKEISAKEIKENPVRLFDEDWGLLTAGGLGDYNTMTISWGTLGELWGRDVCTAFVRPQRHTFGFMEKNGFFTVSFFTDKYKKALSFCGRKSGRDHDKAGETGLTAFDTGFGTAFEEARLIICCKKLYEQNMSESCFLDKSILTECYANGDFHKAFVGEIVKVLVKK